MVIRRQYIFKGIVQGVGFRPFLHRLAKAHNLSGLVRNSSDGVVVEVEGPESALDAFLCDVLSHPPPLARIIGYREKDMEVCHDTGFRIISSEKGKRGEVHISPDIAVCEECLQELFTPGDRRYLYPFINCTNCGPRLTIIRGIPYDRKNTSMACFPLCAECMEEYEDPSDRRFHAEPTACCKCGPALRFLDSEGREVPGDNVLGKAKDVLLQGFIVAVKGLGGFHLAVDATNDRAVARLRERKNREEKPLAIMVRNIEEASEFCFIGEEERELLCSRQRPIVLLRKKGNVKISRYIAPGMAHYGVMLPYTPLHYLLMDETFQALVMTSANQKDEPISIGNREAVTRLRGIADFFLVHDRDVLVRCDDSVAMVVKKKPRVLRRSRGFAPEPVPLSESYPEVLALGPQIKSTVCLLKGSYAFLSPHVGDMETPQARDFLKESVALMKTITECEPTIVACDLHPGYYSSRLCRTMAECTVVKVQHHHAHVVSCMAENGLSGNVIGLAMDGTGYGTDGQVWGGEFLLADECLFRRAGHIKYYLLPGGEAAIREPWRVAASLLWEAYGSAWKKVAGKLELLPQGEHGEVFEKVLTTRIHSPWSSSLGRMFDALAALIGIRRRVSFEGQAAMELEAFAKTGDNESTVSLPFELSEREGILLLDLVPTVRRFTEAFLEGVSPAELAYAFHRTLSKAFTSMVITLSQKTGLRRVVLTGGCFQNRILLERCIEDLEEAGFEVYSHSLIPMNDGGISLGQAVSAGARIKRGS